MKQKFTLTSPCLRSTWLLLISLLCSLPQLQAQTCAAGDICAAGETAQSFAAAGTTIQTSTVPAGANSVTITARGADGGSNDFYNGGAGAVVVGSFTVIPGQVLEIHVGVAGGSSRSPIGNNNNGAGGGGGTGVRIGSSNTDILVIAGGGGGAGGVASGNGGGGFSGTGNGGADGGGGGLNTGGSDGIIGGSSAAAGGGGGFGAAGGSGIADGGAGVGGGASAGIAGAGGGGGGYSGGDGGGFDFINNGGDGGTSFATTAHNATNVSVVPGTSGGAGAAPLDGSVCLCYSPVLVPVELTYFHAKATPQGNQLTWQTATETNNAGFDIERSKDGQNWQTLTFIKGHGTTVETQNYSYLDKDLTGFQNLSGLPLYYRLRQVDYDGAFEYSEVIAVNTKSTIDNKQLHLFPNPVVDILNYQVADLKSVQRVQLFDVNGKLLRETTVIDGQLALNALPKGVYLLVLETASGQLQQRVVKE